MNGYHNRVAWINLTDRSIEFKTLDQKDVDDYVGGASLGALYLSRLTDSRTDPLGPENPMIFMTGPFTGTKVPAGSRYEIVSLSPQTGIYGESNSGGSFGWAMKRNGFDGLVVTGSSETPVALVIEEEKISFREADDLWGLDIFTADEKIKEEMGKKTVSAMIGPAGENRVLYASVNCDGRRTRAAGRCGMGAVMGSKKLKAVCISGTGKQLQPLADADGLAASIKAASSQLMERLELFSGMGTPGGVAVYEKLGNLPIKNWQEARAEELAEKTTGATMKETIWVSRAGCKGCPIQCGRIVENKEGPFALDGAMEGPEYETLASFGALLGNDNLEAIAKCNELCNRLGLDTISAGMVVAWAIECVEKGAILESETDGLKLEWGGMEAVIELLSRIATGQGNFAQTLGLGTKKASQVFGRHSAEYSVEVKGLEFPMHDPRFSWGHALSYPTGNRGACHLSTLSHPFEIGVAIPDLGYDEPYPGREREGKAQWVIHLQHLMTLLDSVILCKFVVLNNALTIRHFVDWYNLAMGKELSVQEFMELGERAFTLKRMINNRRGISRKDDILPPRMRTLKKIGHEVDYDIPPLLPMLSEYYDIRGWTEEGFPSRETVDRLGIEF